MDQDTAAWNARVPADTPTQADGAGAGTDWGLLPATWTGTTRRLGVTWLVSRAIMVVAALPFANDVMFDVYYYWQRVTAMSDPGAAGALQEYPTPVVWMLTLPSLLGTGGGYLAAFVALMVALDVGMLIVLWRAQGRRRGPATDLWLVFTLALGVVIYLRIDLIPAALVGVALVALARYPGLAGAAVGLGAAVKLWPALLLPVLLVRRPTIGRPAGRARAIIGFAVAGLGLALLSVLVAGPDRLLSPLRWQAARGLQIESIWATPLMLLQLISPGAVQVLESPYNALEVFGPGVPAMLAVSDVATALGLLVIATLVVRAFRYPRPDRQQVALLALSIVLIVIVSNKTLSPQYLVWLAGPLAVSLLDVRAGDARFPSARLLAWAMVALALATQLVYPAAHIPLTAPANQLELIVSVVLLAARNVGLVLVTLWVVVWCWRSLRPAAPSRDPSGDASL